MERAMVSWNFFPQDKNENPLPTEPEVATVDHIIQRGETIRLLTDLEKKIIGGCATSDAGRKLIADHWEKQPRPMVEQPTKWERRKVIFGNLLEILMPVIFWSQCLWPDLLPSVIPTLGLIYVWFTVASMIGISLFGTVSAFHKQRSMRKLFKGEHDQKFARTLQYIKEKTLTPKVMKALSMATALGSVATWSRILTISVLLLNTHIVTAVVLAVAVSLSLAFLVWAQYDLRRTINILLTEEVKK